MIAPARQTRVDRVRKHYDQRAEYWSGVYSAEDEDGLTIYATHYRQRRSIVMAMLDQVSPPPGVWALDVGCGPGAYIQPLLDRGFKVAAVDQAPEMVKQARENYDPRYDSDVIVGLGNAESLPFPPMKFKVIICIALMHYVDDEVKAANELYRLLQPGGTLILVVDNKKDLSDSIDILMRSRRLFRRLFAKLRSRKTTGSGAQVDKLEPLKRPYSPKEFRRLLLSTGFIIDEDTSIGFAPFRINGKRTLSDAANRKLDRALQFLKKVPGLRLSGYMYVVRCHRPT